MIKCCETPSRYDSKQIMASNETEVVVEFRHVGSAPILKKEKAKLRIPADKPFSTATLLLRRLLSLQDSQPLVRAIPGECVARTFTARAKALSLSLSSCASPLTQMFPCCVDLPQFLYCSSAFAPPPDERLSDVKACFAHSDGVLILNYCLQPAWG